MKKRWISLALTLAMLIGMFPALTFTVKAADAPTALWVEPSETNSIPAQIDVFVSATSTSGYGTNRTTTYTCLLCLPGSADPAACVLSWDGGMSATVGGTSYESSACPVPAPGETRTLEFNGISPKRKYVITTYQGSASVPAVFIDIDESQGTIAAMDSDPDHEASCSGQICIDGTWYTMERIKGRGNATWENARDKKPYNIKLAKKINFPGVDSAATKNWSFLAEVLDRSLLCNRSGFHLAYELGIGQDTASADVWMNGEYQGCYTVTPKTDSFVTKDGFMIEQDNYMEKKSVAEGGDPQFKLDGLISNVSGWSSAYNVITVKKIGDNLLGEGGETPESIQAAADSIQDWLQDAWDAIRSADGYNSKGKYYTDYIDIESFAKMYLMQEYIKSYDVCAGSILFHRDGQTEADRLIAGPLWDLDNAMGSTYNNSYLGTSASDRRSAQGDFIPVITEYKTSIYKTLSKHPDFMEEVEYQYNKHKAAFDSLASDVEGMMAEIEASAVMNHAKVQDLGNSTGKNNHYYRRDTTLGSGQYQQTYVATNNWANYAANLVTYIRTRSLWFANNYYDPNFCDHTFEEVVTTPPTCTEPGEVTKTCTKCGKTEREPVPATGHDFDEAGVCNVCGFEAPRATISCGDGASVTVYTTGSFDTVAEEGAVSANPRDSKTGMIDASGEGQINFVVNLEPGYALDSVIATPDTSYKNLKKPEDTGIENGYRLTKVKGDLTITVTTKCTHEDSLSHVGAVSPTCTEPGNREYWYCSRCGSYFSDAACENPIEEGSWVLEALEHDYKTAEETAVAATCTEAGKEADQVCSRCGDVIEGEAIEALGHDFGEWTETTAPTCTEDGEETRVCARCDEVETRTVEALGHDYEAEVIDPTCTAGGYTTYTCKRCDDSYTEDETEALGHDFGDWTETEEATCTETGEETRSCSRCDAVETRTVDALGHSWSEWTETKPATETEEGEETRTCARCGETETRSIPMLSHIHRLSKIDAVEPTCTEPGSIEYWICDQGDNPCGKYFSDAEGLHEIELEDTVRSALGHSFGAWTVTTPATCTAVGEETRTCAGCGITETHQIDALGHALVRHSAKAATCTEKGNSEYWSCDRCHTYFSDAGGNTVISENSWVIPASGHSLTAHAAVAATCTAPGNSAYWSCSKCGRYFSDAAGKTAIAKDSWVIKALGHAYQEVPGTAKAASCTGTGKEADRKCSRCGNVIAGAVIPASCPSRVFKDVNPNPSNWYHPHVDYAVEHGLMNGTSATTFEPDGTITRAMVVTILYRMSGEPAVSGAPAFSDVPAGKWYSNAIKWATDKGIAKGVGGGKFDPDAPVTREQMSTFLMRYAKFKGKSTSTSTSLSGYTDAGKVSSWAVDAVKWSVGNGIIVGTSATTLDPESTATRAQFATIVHRYLDKFGG